MQHAVPKSPIEVMGESDAVYTHINGRVHKAVTRAGEVGGEALYMVGREYGALSGAGTERIWGETAIVWGELQTGAELMYS